MALYLVKYRGKFTFTLYTKDFTKFYMLRYDMTLLPSFFLTSYRET